ncbi:MAG: trypsin-like peptidase domain-containing protein [candidate division WWE3 bacterium]|nr:trypsin-like peptidase domain-containing protein [candidate division WWE3 bacterium]
MKNSKKILGIFIVSLVVVTGGVLGLVYQKRLNLNLSNNPISSFFARLTKPVVIQNNTVTVVDEESAVISAVTKVSPAVVSVVTQSTSFDPFSGQQSSGTQGIGTGFIVRSDGVILTNKHVVADPNVAYTVVLKDKTSYPVKKVFLDPSNDLAIIKIDATNLPTVELGDSSKLKVGQGVIAIGNALGRFDNTVTKGVVSALGRGITAGSGNPFDQTTENLADVIQTDASMNPGNSGGPLVNLSGQVIGIDSAVSGGAQGIGFALPINSAKPVISSFEATGRIVRPYMGVVYELVTPDLTTFTRLPVGALVRSAVAGSPAEKAGIKPGDVILSISGEKIDENTTLVNAILKHQVGETVPVVIDRSGAKLTLQVTLVEIPAK